MAKYRKKPVIIEAVKFEQNTLQWPDGVEWDSALQAPVIRTLEGSMMVSDGDYVITGVKGERYPCKPDIFHATYEPVEVSA